MTAKDAPPSVPAGTGDVPGIKTIVLYNMAGFALNIYDTVLAAWVLYFYIPPEGSGHLRYIGAAALGLILAGGGASTHCPIRWSGT